MSILVEKGQWKNIYLKDIPLNESIIVTKTDEKVWENESKQFKDKQGNPSKFYTTKVGYEGHSGVGVLYSFKQNQDWKPLPNGEVKITRLVKELEGGKLINNYVFEAVEGNSSPSLTLTKEDKLTEMEQEILSMAKATGKSDYSELLFATLKTYKEKYPNKIGDISETRVRGWL